MNSQDRDVREYVAQKSAHIVSAFFVVVILPAIVFLPKASAAERCDIPGECAAKRHYKKAMCELSISRGIVKGSVERCAADPRFVGRTVRRGGVGG